MRYFQFYGLAAYLVIIWCIKHLWDKSAGREHVNFWTKDWCENSVSSKFVSLLMSLIFRSAHKCIEAGGVCLRTNIQIETMIFMLESISSRMVSEWQRIDNKSKLHSTVFDNGGGLGDGDGDGNAEAKNNENDDATHREGTYSKLWFNDRENAFNEKKYHKYFTDHSGWTETVNEDLFISLALPLSLNLHM